MIAMRVATNVESYNAVSEEVKGLKMELSVHPWN